MKALIVLEDGTTFWGKSFTGRGEVFGEIVFNTAMTGYQEILTDPSYRGQIVTMTYPLIGNYGVNDEDNESLRIQVEAFVVREYQPFYSNWRAKRSLGDWLKSQGVLGIEQVDTRAITRHIRLAGAMKAGISTEDLNPSSLLEKVKAAPGLVGRDLVKEVTCNKPYRWVNGEVKDFFPFDPKGGFRVVVIDCGLKFNQLRLMEERGLQLLVVPATTSAEEILSYEPDGVFFSNGPGDPAAVPYVVETAKKLLGKKPIFGICLGHQMIGQALGASTYKLKFGHRGANQPVKDLATGRIEITSQNHGFCVRKEELPKEVEISHINLNDGTLEGIKHRELPLFSVQYHPENAPGPHDSVYLFDRFVDMIKAFAEGKYQ
ncbi:glutamine-hydrolyzing carbamoyl-phosphate synthase small subunit [Thermodesulfatator autotrophicus]|uniref:Carbamoyl phosphate synthase small chain n=1 Tax=Thermodesulfatator autotrophicus TaxID=1795632 RepID=A0A177EB86_9BACT|nr:glutamine-hydrolyzing carbamoyl-phosphate synthase small subunit [Thermodesulfatator autotrophicus]OAG28771.1 carbamoyl-phosphate synthase small subunit [Thermodesulfatator autotrophicus]